MRAFHCRILDDRYPAPRSSWLIVADRERAAELAREELLRDACHRAVELREKGRLVLALTRAEAAAAATDTPPE